MEKIILSKPTIYQLGMAVVEKEYTYQKENGKEVKIKRKYYTLPKDKKYRKRFLKNTIDGTGKLNQFQFDVIYSTLTAEIPEEKAKCILAILSAE